MAIKFPILILFKILIDNIVIYKLQNTDILLLPVQRNDLLTMWQSVVCAHIPCKCFQRPYHVYTKIVYEIACLFIYFIKALQLQEWLQVKINACTNSCVHDKTFSCCETASLLISYIM